MKTQQLVPCAPREVFGSIVTRKWVFGETSEPLKVGDEVEFLVSGSGRGGHVSAFATVTKIKPKTFDCVERKGSYCHGKTWNIPKNYESLILSLPDVTN